MAALQPRPGAADQTAQQGELSTHVNHPTPPREPVPSDRRTQRFPQTPNTWRRPPCWLGCALAHPGIPDAVLTASSPGVGFFCVSLRSASLLSSARVERVHTCGPFLTGPHETGSVTTCSSFSVGEAGIVCPKPCRVAGPYEMLMPFPAPALHQRLCNIISLQLQNPGRDSLAVSAP